MLSIKNEDCWTYKRAMKGLKGQVAVMTVYIRSRQKVKISFSSTQRTILAVYFLLSKLTNIWKNSLRGDKSPFMLLVGLERPLAGYSSLYYKTGRDRHFLVLHLLCCPVCQRAVSLLVSSCLARPPCHRPLPKKTKWRRDFWTKIREINQDGGCRCMHSSCGHWQRKQNGVESSV